MFLYTIHQEIYQWKLCGTQTQIKDIIDKTNGG